jgi:uncharacterized membrane protein YjjP (DUF1212 family)
MNFTFTTFDKAIVAAIAGPIIVFVTTYLNGSAFDEKSFVAAVVAAAFAGLAVYLKGNAPATPPAAKP